MPVWIRCIVCVCKMNSYRDWEYCIRRQRSPAYVIIIVSPLYPCRGPLIIRNPYPSIVIVVIPSSVVIYYVTKWFIRIPVPSIGGPYPTTVCIRSPSNSHMDRLPAVNTVSEFDPGSIWWQWGIKITETTIIISPVIITIIISPVIIILGFGLKTQTCDD